MIRALNMAPETVVGQIRPEISDARVHEDMFLKKKTFAGSWEGRLLQKSTTLLWSNVRTLHLTIDWEDGAVMY